MARPVSRFLRSSKSLPYSQSVRGNSDTTSGNLEPFRRFVRLRIMNFAFCLFSEKYPACLLVVSRFGRPAPDTLFVLFWMGIYGSRKRMATTRRKLAPSTRLTRPGLLNTTYVNIWYMIFPILVTLLLAPLNISSINAEDTFPNFISYWTRLGL